MRKNEKPSGNNNVTKENPAGEKQIMVVAESSDALEKLGSPGVYLYPNPSRFYLRIPLLAMN